MRDEEELRPADLPIGSQILRDGEPPATKRFTADPQWYLPGAGWFSDEQAHRWVKDPSSTVIRTDAESGDRVAEVVRA